MQCRFFGFWFGSVFGLSVRSLRFALNWIEHEHPYWIMHYNISLGVAKKLIVFIKRTMHNILGYFVSIDDD